MATAVQPFRPSLTIRSLFEPFDDAASAWFWAISALAARQSGAGSRDPARILRPCEPDDVIRTLDRLHGSGVIGLYHIRVLRKWGQAGMSPDRSLAADRPDRVLWVEALTHLQQALAIKGIVKDHNPRNISLTRAPA